ncbi:hypothetical protein RAA17_23245 [Komagataeibacter rhaeticus]|nr:hypothetical protein [Komagataeibacter rhaeticus]
MQASSGTKYPFVFAAIMIRPGVVAMGETRRLRITIFWSSREISDAIMTVPTGAASRSGTTVIWLRGRVARVVIFHSPSGYGPVAGWPDCAPRYVS